MNLQKLAKQIRREAKANPKKAAILGLMALVAIYFWAPLVAGWCKKDPGSTRSGSPVVSSAIASPGAASTAPSSAIPPMTGGQTAAAGKPKQDDAPVYSWNKLAEWMDKDPRTKPALAFGSGRDPFRKPKLEPVQVKAEAARPGELETSLQSLKLVLAGTIVGPQRRIARINGKTYQRGATIDLVAKDGKELALTLAEVGPRSVVLEYQGKRFELKMAAPGNTPGRIELFGSVP